MPALASLRETGSAVPRWYELEVGIVCRKPGSLAMESASACGATSADCALPAHEQIPTKATNAASQTGDLAFSSLRSFLGTLIALSHLGNNAVRNQIIGASFMISEASLDKFMILFSFALDSTCVSHE